MDKRKTKSDGIYLGPEVSLSSCYSYAIAAEFYRVQSPSAKVLRALQAGPNRRNWGDIFAPELGLTATAIGGIVVPDRPADPETLACAANDDLQLYD